MKIYWIDLFCGAGGTTTGIHLAEANAEVIACVNHDKNAIEAHKLNHPDCLHFMEDIRDFKVVEKLLVLVTKLRNETPDCIINIWASLECTNYSKAKGGLPRDGDSRTLANHLFMYLEHLNPDYLYIENVREFMSWGPLDENGKPISRKKGTDYIQWIEKVKAFGFNYDSKLLNSADFGAYQSRERYFGIFAKKGMPILFPEPTHYNPKKKKTNGFFEMEKQPWKAVRDVLQLEEKGVSIFKRKKDLSENTHKRIYAGLLKFVAGGENEFIKRYNGGNPAEKVKSLNQPIGSISTSNRHAIVSTSFLTSYYGNGQAHSTKLPCPTVTTKDRFALNYLLYDYSSFTASGIDQPAGTITTTPKHNLVTNEWLTDTQYGRVGQLLNKPCFTLIARMDKKPPYIINALEGPYVIEIKPTDNPTVIKIKKFMALYGITDIKMRMLFLQELKRIQGFPENYMLSGTQTEQKKQIGNAVEVHQSKALIEANASAINKYLTAA